MPLFYDRGMGKRGHIQIHRMFRLAAACVLALLLLLVSLRSSGMDWKSFREEAAGTAGRIQSLFPGRGYLREGTEGAVTASSGIRDAASGEPVLVLDHDTNTNACYYLEQIEKELRKNYPQLYRCLARAEEGRPNAYIIPGMVQTATLSAADGTPGVSTAMDPQGLAITTHYLIISAYSKDLQYNSVLYVLDRATGAYIKTIVLPGTPHVGGIAYDPVAKRLWIADSRGEKSRLCALDQRTLDKVDFARDGKVCVYDAIVPIDNPKDAAFIAYYEDSIYAGSFEREGGGIMVRYPLGERRLPGGKEEDIVRSAKTATLMQGVTPYGDRLIFSQSWGPADSRLVLYENESTDYVEETKKGEMTLPPYLEQIVCDGEDLYILFESPAAKYRRNEDITHVDRVLRLNLRKMQGSAQTRQRGMER